jgi:hypothetical protein
MREPVASGEWRVARKSARIGHRGTENTELELSKLETRKTKLENALPLVFLDV